MVQDEADLDDYVSGENDDPESSSDLDADFAAKLNEVFTEVDNIFDQRAV